MKKTIISIAVITAAFVAASCQKENLQENIAPEGNASVFTATIETGADTKTTVERVTSPSVAYKTYWESTDKISINGVTYTADPDDTDATKAAFTKDSGDDPTGPFNAYFPANLYNNGTPTLPANVSETWADGKFNMPMYATSTTTSLTFKNLCGMLKITVTNTQLDKVKCITVSSTNCATSGAFTVTDNKAVLTDASKTANTVTVTYTEAVATDATGKVFYVAIPAQIYKNLSIAVSNGTTTKVMTTKKDQDIEVVHNTVYPIAFNGQSTTGTAKRTGDINVSWTQLWANGPKLAEYNVSTTTGYGDLYAWTENIVSSNWGSNWKMPSKTDFENLLANCDVQLSTVNDVKGYNFTGKGAYASNSVFLPAAGYIDGSGHQGERDMGFYWSSTPDDSTNAFCLWLINQESQMVFSDGRGNKFSVRAVLAEQD